MIALLQVQLPSAERYVENDRLKLGIDLARGGAITYLAPKPDLTNLVNDFDLGRQIQMSFYSGPIPYTPDGKKPMESWAGLGWNPIQVGDCFGHPSRILSFRRNVRSLYIKCVPMQWPLDNVPGECTFESWITLKGNVAHVRDRITDRRADRTQYAARTQELPAIYTNGPWYHLFSYTGSHPFANDPVTELPHVFMWRGFWASEHWAALMNDQGTGLGIVEPEVYTMSGGFFGQPGAGDAHSAPSGYISPNRVEILDCNIQYDYSYDLVVGSLEDVRKVAQQVAAKPDPLDFRFDTSRLHWSYVNTHDKGWPIRGALSLILEKNDPQMIAPPFMVDARKASTFVLEGAFKTSRPTVQILWQTFDSPNFSEDKSLTFQVKSDGKDHVYSMDLSRSRTFKGILTGLRVDPEPTGSEGDWARIKRIALTAGS